jgi:type II secretion system protein H
MRERGMTLVELMIVVAIVGVMSAVAMFAMGPANNAKQAASLARSLQFAMQRARVDAVSDNKQRRIRWDPTTPQKCIYQVATTTGMSSTVAFQTAYNDIPIPKAAQVFNITNATDLVDNSGSKITAAAFITFYPNGTASPGTFYVSDTNATKGSKYKNFVYAGTGMARMVDRW